MTTLEEVYKVQQEIFESATKLVKSKGHDYNFKQQEEGDTLFNLRVAKLLGVTEFTTQGILVRLSDKFMRLASLTSNPTVNPEVKDESVKDTIRDIWNYTAYLWIFYQEEREKALKEK